VPQFVELDFQALPDGTDPRIADVRHTSCSVCQDVLSDVRSV
jgi:hypothetical protein